MRRRLNNARVLVTGASSGIGRAVAVELARCGTQLLLTARRGDRLAALRDELTGPASSVDLVPGDLTQPEHRRELAAWIDREWGALDGLVNAAGAGAIGPFDQADPSRLRTLMEIDFFAPVELIRRCLPLLRKGRRPVIVNIVSVLGHRGVPLKSEYCAAKFALRGFSQSLRAELADHPIDVVVVSPSTTATEFFEVLHERRGPEPKWKGRAMSSAAVARATVRAMRRGRHEVILSAGGRTLVWLDRLAPSLADVVMARWGK